MRVLLLLVVLSVPAQASLLSYASPCCGGGYNISAQGFLSITVNGGSGGGFVFPILDVTADTYTGDTAYSSISLGGISTSGSQKCFQLCGLYDPAYVQGDVVPPEDLQYLIPIQFGQALVLPYSVSLAGTGYGPDGSAQLEAWLVFNATGQKLTGAYVVENGFVSPEPSTLSLMLVTALLVVLMGTGLSKVRH